MSAAADRLTLSQPSARLGASSGSVSGLTMRVLDGEAWDRLIADFDDVCQEQLHAFASVRWGRVDLEPVVFERDGEIIGGALMMIQALPLSLACIALSKWGPMLRDEARPDAATLYSSMLDALIAEYAGRRHQMLSIMPHASVDQGNWRYQSLLARGFKAGTALAFPDRYIVRLPLSDAEQRKSFAQKWRYHLNKAEKAGLSFEHAPAERVGDFDRLYRAMTDRKQFPDYSAYDTVAMLVALESDKLRPELFFVRHEGELVAGAVIFKAGRRAVYLYGATNDKALPLRAGYFMHWHIIRWLRDNTQAEWYDLGGTDGFQGLHQFKKGMVGDAGLVSSIPPMVNYASSPVAYLLGNGAFLAREGFHKLRNRLSSALRREAKPDQARSETDQ